MFAGINGYEYAGVTYTRTWQHSTNACVDCHMNTFDATAGKGGHSLVVNKNACTSCHGSDKLTPIQTAIDAKLVELSEALFLRKVMKKTTNSSGVVSYSAETTHNFNGKLYPKTQTPGDKFAKASKFNTVSPTIGLVIYGSMLTYNVDAYYTKRIGRPWKYGELGATYNYGYIKSELSKDIHNKTYALQLLQASIDWLAANK